MWRYVKEAFWARVTTPLTGAQNLVDLYRAWGGDATLDAPAKGGPVVPAGAAPPGATH